MLVYLVSVSLSTVLYRLPRNDRQIVLVMELMVNGSLSSFLARRREEGKEELEPTIRHQLARDVAQGMVFLHEKNIVHKDLKAENVLLDGRLRAKV